MRNEVCQSYIVVDPRTKVIILLCAGITILGLVPLWVEILLIAFLELLLVNGHQFQTAVHTTILFICMVLLDKLLLPHLSGALGVIVLSISRIIRIYLPIYLSFTLIVRTTPVSQCIAAFTKMHITPKIVIPLAVVFRFVPTIREEWQSIHAAMKLRGIALDMMSIIKKPVMTLEYVMVPLLMSTSTISEELAAASLSHGLTATGTRTCLLEVKLRLIDLLLISISLAFVIIAKVVLPHA